LRVEVVPAAKRDRANSDNGNHSGNEFRLVFNAPVGGVSRRLECDLAEAVLFQLMPGFCAHRLPSWLKGRMTIVQFNRGISGASKLLVKKHLASAFTFGRVAYASRTIVVGSIA